MRKLITLLITVLTLTSCTLDESGDYWLVRTDVNAGWSIQSNDRWEEHWFERVKILRYYEEGDLVPIYFPHLGGSIKYKLPVEINTDGSTYLYQAVKFSN